MCDNATNKSSVKFEIQISSAKNITDSFKLIIIFLRQTFNDKKLSSFNRVSITNFCAMDLGNFPFDTQLCKFFLEPCKSYQFFFRPPSDGNNNVI